MKLFYIILFFLFTCFATAQEPFWVQMDVPTTGDNQTKCLKQRGDTLYLASSSGLYRSTNAAENWELISRGQFEQIYVTSQHYLLARILILTTYYLIKSYDYGNTWDTLALASYFCPEAHESWNDIEEFVVDNTDNIYISYDNGRYNCDNIEGIYRSKDLGENWEKIDTLFHEAKISAYDSNHFSISLVKYKYAGDSALVKITKDGGKTYKIFENDYESAPGIMYVDSNRIFMFLYGLHYSSNGGDTWQILNRPEKTDIYSSEPLFINDSSYYIWAEGDKMTEGDALYFTNDLSKTWQKMSQDTLIMSDISFYGDFQLIKDSFFIATHCEGVTKSIDGGKYFKLENQGYYNYSRRKRNSLEFDRYGNVYLGDGSNLFISRNNGDTWEKERNRFLGFQHFIEAPNGEMLCWAGDWLSQARLLRSKDQGRHWDTVKANSGSYGAVRKAPNGNMYSFFPFLRSTDNGDTWGDRKDPDIKYLNSQLTGLVNNKNELFVANDEGQIYRSQDEGDTWDVVDNRIDAGSGIRCGIFVPKTDIGHCLTSKNHRATTDNGATWFKVPYQFEGNAFFSMVMDSLGNLWAGIYKSTDYGFTWQADSSGLELGPETYVMQIGVNANGYVFIGLSNRGLYRSRIPFIDPAKYEENYSLEQEYAIFPNPAEDYLFINDYNSYSQDRIRIFSAAGVEVLASAFTRQLDISSLPAGVYYLKIGLKHFRFVKV